MDMESASPRTIEPEASAREAARRMDDGHVGYLVVVDDGRPVGLITDRDVALGVLAGGRDPESCPVREIMSTPVVTLRAELAPEQAARVMRENAIRKLPLVDAEGRLAEVVTADDLVVSLGRRVHDLADAVQRELMNEAFTPASGSKVFGTE